jgi:DNA-binding SARP family transcriptional activator
VVLQPIHAPNLHILLLGSPDVRWGDESMPVARRQLRGLIYYLAAQTEAVPRDRLSMLFWADLPSTLARRNLTRLLNQLRTILPDPGLLYCLPDTILLDSRRVWCDALVFEQLCSQPNPANPLQTLESATRLFRGEFLSGFTLAGSPAFEEWVQSQRQAVERRYLLALRHMLELQAAQADYDQAILCAQRYLAIDEFAEGVHRRLIELYARTGQRELALRQYHFLRCLLETELGVTPLLETQAAWQAVLRHHAPAAAPSPPPADLPFTGREEELSRLNQALDQAAAGQGGLLFLCGEPGIGKTRLLHHWLGQLHARRGEADGPVAVGLATGYPDTHKYPYHFAAQVLRRLAQRLPPEAGRDLAARLQGCLDAISLPQPGHQLRETLTSWLFDLAALAPMVLAFDNLQWADSSTLNWLLYMSRHIGPQRVLIVSAYTPEFRPALLTLQCQLARQSALVELVLEGIAPDQLAAALPNRPGIEQLYRLTGGNPYFVQAYLPAFLTGAAVADLSVPAALAAFIRLRLDHVSAAARKVIYAAAVLPAGLSFDQAQVVAGQSEGETLDGLDELLAGQLLVEAGSRYYFRHQAVRSVVQDGMSRGRRRVLLRRAGES